MQLILVDEIPRVQGIWLLSPIDLEVAHLPVMYIARFL
jgi:hypothetical protein